MTAAEFDLVLDDVPYDPAAEARRRAEERALHRLRQVGWIWCFHGGLLVGTATLMGLLRVVFVYFHNWVQSQLDVRLISDQFSDLEVLERLTALIVWTIPIFLPLGVIVLVASIGFLRRRAWAWRWLYVLSWIHLVGLIPTAIFFGLAVSQIGLPRDLPAWLKHFGIGMDIVLLLATQVLLVWVHYHLRSPVVIGAFREPDGTSLTDTEAFRRRRGKARSQ